MKKFSILKIAIILFITTMAMLHFLNNYYNLNLNSTILDDEIIAYISIIVLLVDIIVDSISERISDVKEVKDYYNDIRGSIRGSVVLNQNDSVAKEDLIKNKIESKDTSDIIELMLFNMKEIKEYYVMSKSMAKSSFTLSVVMCVLGFIVISSSIAAIFFTNITFMESLIPVIGGTVVEAIAGTSLIVYKKSLEQLNQYYESLHNNERYLSLVNLVDKLSNDRKDETYINIINSQLEVLKKLP